LVAPTAVQDDAEAHDTEPYRASDALTPLGTGIAWVEEYPGSAAATPMATITVVATTVADTRILERTRGP
jgi:hypothetical protein